MSQGSQPWHHARGQDGRLPGSSGQRLTGFSPGIPFRHGVPGNAGDRGECALPMPESLQTRRMPREARYRTSRRQRLDRPGVGGAWAFRRSRAKRDPDREQKGVGATASRHRVQAWMAVIASRASVEDQSAGRSADTPASGTRHDALKPLCSSAVRHEARRVPEVGFRIRTAIHGDPFFEATDASPGPEPEVRMAGCVVRGMRISKPGAQLPCLPRVRVPCTPRCKSEFRHHEPLVMLHDLTHRLTGRAAAPFKVANVENRHADPPPCSQLLCRS